MVAECKDRDFSSNARTIRLFRRAVRPPSGGTQKKPLRSERLFGGYDINVARRAQGDADEEVRNQRTTVFPCRLMTNVPDSGC